MSVRTLRYNTATQHFTKSALASTDRDALAFIEAAGIYNTNQQKAIVDLVRGLKRTGLWSKMKAIYPFIGGTASSHKWNLKDPRDVDAAFRLTFSGGWTHSSTGALPNATTAYADTYVVPNSNLAENNIALSYYSRTSTAATGVEMGMLTTGSPLGLVQLVVRYTLSTTTNRLIFASYSTTNEFFATNTDGTGYYIGTRTANNSSKIYKNGTTQATSTTLAAGFTKATLNLYLCARNQTNGIFEYSNKQCAFATIGDGLTDTEATALYNIVDLYQKRLGRAV